MSRRPAWLSCGSSCRSWRCWSRSGNADAHSALGLWVLLEIAQKLVGILRLRRLDDRPQAARVEAAIRCAVELIERSGRGLQLLARDHALAHAGFAQREGDQHQALEVVFERLQPVGEL